MRSNSHEYPIESLEDMADVLIMRGEFELALLALSSVLSQSRSRESLEQHHASIKKAALPFFELARFGHQEQITENALAVYGQVGELLESQLSAFTDSGGTGLNRSHALGRLAETIIFCLQARSVNEQSTSLTIPSSVAEDKSYINGVDFFQIPIYPSENSSLSIQVKLASQNRYGRYDESICFVTLKQLDPNFCFTPEHPHSLPSCILRELEGTSDDQDIDKITLAQSNLETTLATHKKRYSNELSIGN